MAGTIKITPEQARAVAAVFRAKSQETEAMRTELNTQVNSMQPDWEGMASMKFYQEFLSWDQTMLRFVGLLEQIAQELEKIALQLEQTDQQLSSGMNVQF
jgi:WXG100 family type VII secretion target